MSSDFDYFTTVKPEWIDHNGHMNVAYYVVAFDEATDEVYEHWGLGLDYPEDSGCSVFTLGMNVDYLGELFDGDPLRIETRLVDHDHKRIHYFHSMYHDGTGALAARNECLCMNVDLATRRSRDFPQSVLQKLAAALDREEPEGFGRRLRIRRGSRR